ncbi:MAG: hypothetical protein IT442_08180 [Phycisphaeraceae bacterium]|nr:hypothetical protein [Phycisphaeraceae bacterium]
MERIELPCPSCGKTLKVDAGFAGSVCRCKYCGSLISIPDPLGLSDPKNLDAPDRADRPASPGKPEASAPTSPRTGRKTRPGDTLPMGSPIVAPEPSRPHAPMRPGEFDPHEQEDEREPAIHRAEKVSPHKPSGLTSGQRITLLLGLVAALLIIVAAAFMLLYPF